MKPNQHVTFALKLAGWEFEGPVPSQKKYVLLAVPHTSNWDGVELSWMVKDSMARGPMRPLMRQLNAVPIDRSRANNVVQAMADEFARRDRFVLAIPPEGTRSRVEYWKSGFYNIARAANVPVATGYLDFARRRAGIGDPIDLTGNVAADMDRIRAFYLEKKPAPHAPEKFGPMRLKAEED